MQVFKADKVPFCYSCTILLFRRSAKNVVFWSIRCETHFVGKQIMVIRFMNGPLRFLVYLAVIAVIVSGSLFYLSKESPPSLFPGGGLTASPPPPWKKTQRAVAEANEDFSVEYLGGEPSGDGKVKSLTWGASWPQFNGAQRDNRSPETGLLEAWPIDGPPLLWSARGLGNGYSSVAVVAGVVFTLGNKAESEVMIALEARSGKKIWCTPFARASHASMGDGPRGTPAVSDGAVYGMGAEGELARFDVVSGEIQWHRNILTDYSAPNIGWGISESVLIDGDQLICTPGGSKATMVALDKNTGKEIWRSVVDGEHAGYASAIVVEIDGVRQYVQFLAGGVAGIRADDGTFLWKNTKPSSGTANCSSPLVWGNHVFCASNYGTGGSLIKLVSASRSTTAELVYHTQDMKSHHGDMVIEKGMLFGSNDPGILMCLDVETGKVKWQNRSIGKGAVTFAEGKIYLRGENSEIALVEATGDEYRELGRFEQPDRSSANAWSHPVVANGCLFLRDQGLLLCYNLKRN